MAMSIQDLLAAVADGPSQARPNARQRPRPSGRTPARPMQPMSFNAREPRQAVPLARGSFAGERVEPQLPQSMMRPAAAPPKMNEQELMEMLFAAYQDRNMSGRNRGARGFRGKPVTGI